MVNASVGTRGAEEVPNPGGHQRRTFDQRRRKKGPDLLGVPGSQRDHGTAGKILLQQLKSLRIGMGRPVFTGLEAGMGANQNKGAVGIFKNSLPGLVSDCMQPGADMTESGDKGGVG